MRVRRILVVDDDRPSLDACARALGTLPDSEVEREEKSADALRRLGAEPWDLLVTDLRMPGADGRDLLKVAQAQDPDIPVLLLTGSPTVDTAVTALKEGATDYLTKPIDIDELLAVAERALKDRTIRAEHGVLERRLRSGTDATEIVGASDAVVHVMKRSRQLAESDLDVLILGETGTGKELFARRISRRPRKWRPSEAASSLTRAAPAGRREAEGAPATVANPARWSPSRPSWRRRGPPAEADPLRLQSIAVGEAGHPLSVGGPCMPFTADPSCTPITQARCVPSSRNSGSDGSSSGCWRTSPGPCSSSRSWIPSDPDWASADRPRVGSTYPSPSDSCSRPCSHGITGPGAVRSPRAPSS